MGVEVDQKSVNGALKDGTAEDFSNKTKASGVIVFFLDKIVCHLLYSLITLTF